MRCKRDRGEERENLPWPSSQPTLGSQHHLAGSREGADRLFVLRLASHVFLSRVTTALKLPSCSPSNTLTPFFPFFSFSLTSSPYSSLLPKPRPSPSFPFLLPLPHRFTPPSSLPSRLLPSTPFSHPSLFPFLTSCSFSLVSSSVPLRCLIPFLLLQCPNIFPQHPSFFSFS